MTTSTRKTSTSPRSMPGKVNITSLRTAIDGLRELGDLVETDTPIDPNLEFSALQQRLEDGPAALFNEVQGYEHARLVVNLFATDERVNALFGFSDRAEATKRLAAAIRKPVPPRIVEGSVAPCRQSVVSNDIDVYRHLVPIRHTEMEQEATLGSGICLLAGEHFDGGTHIGFNRMNFRWGNVGTLQVSPGSHLGASMARASQLGERIPLTMNFGVPPAVTFAAGGAFDYVILPYGCDELGIAGAMQGSPTAITPALTVPGAYSIAEAEFVIEGFLDPKDRRYETKLSEDSKTQGEHPFHPEWAGYMGKAYKAPTLHVTAITHRAAESRPLIQPMIIRSIEEVNVQTMLREAALYEFAERLLPGFAQDVHIPYALTEWGGAIFQVAKRRSLDEGYQRNLIVGALATSKGMRIAVAVDEDVDIYDMDDVMWAITTRVNPQTDIMNPLPGGAGQAFQPSQGLTTGGRERKGTNMRFEGGLAIDATVPHGERDQFQRPRYATDRLDLTRWFPNLPGQ